MTVTIGELKGYWRKVADAVSNNKMNVTDADILTALLSIGQTIEDVEAEIRAIKSTEGIKKIADAVKVTADDNTIAGLGSLAAAAVTDPAASASVIALLKGMLKQLQGTGTGAAPVQLTGSYVKNGYVDITSVIGTIPAGGSKTYDLDLSSVDHPVEAISIIGRNDSGGPIKIEIRDGYFTGSNWQYIDALNKEVYPASNATGIKVERIKVMSQRTRIIVTNTGSVDVAVTALNIFLWRSASTDKNVIERSIFNALAISDTSFKYGTLVTTSGGKYQIRVRSTLDQPVQIGLSGIDGDRQRGTKTISGSTLGDLTITIPANSGANSIIITPDTWAPLKGPLKSLSLIAKCSVAPTTGSLTAVLVEV